MSVQTKIVQGSATEPWVVQFLAACCVMIGAKKILEIGVMRGETTKALLEVLPKDGKYLAVDPSPKAEFLELLTDTRLHLEQASSHVFLPKLQDEFDFIFVDGDHTFAGAQQDIDQALRLIRVGGIIAVHDVLSQQEPAVGLAARLHLPGAVYLSPVPFEWWGVTGLALYSRPNFVMNISLSEGPVALS